MQTVLHRCSKRFGGRNDRYIVAANDSGVNMTVTSLQQTIWGQYDRYIVAANDSGGNMTVTLLQQLIRRAERAFTSLQHSITTM